MEYVHNDGEVYFAAANTANGFKSYFENIFNMQEIDKLYVLKGGPGVGKSTFMRKTAELCEKQGLTVEYFLCSSDPSSLDGIIVKEQKCAIVDGTSPHSVEAKLAGAYEEIIDLGKAWDTQKLFEKKQQLLSLSLHKKNCYKNAYDYLYVCKLLKSILEDKVKPHILAEKLKKSAARLSKSILSDNSEASGKESIRIINALSCKGKIHLCSFEDIADMCIFIKESKPHYGIGIKYMNLVYEQAKKKGADMLVSLSPFDSSVIDGLYFVKEKVSVTLCSHTLAENCDRQGKKCRIVNVSRFLDTASISNTKAERKFIEKLYDAIEEKALEELKKAGDTHLLLETIYASCTDYTIVTKMLKDFLKNFTEPQKSHQ